MHRNAAAEVHAVGALLAVGEIVQHERFAPPPKKHKRATSSSVVSMSPSKNSTCGKKVLLANESRRSKKTVAVGGLASSMEGSSERRFLLAMTEYLTYEGKIEKGLTGRGGYHKTLRWMEVSSKAS